MLNQIFAEIKENRRKRNWEKKKKREKLAEREKRKEKNRKQKKKIYRKEKKRNLSWLEIGLSCFVVYVTWAIKSVGGFKNLVP